MFSSDQKTDHEAFMCEALKEAALCDQDVPVGAVMVHKGEIIARAHNAREAENDPLAHAEMLCIARAAKRLKRRRLSGCTLYVTLEPCPMCAGALVMAQADAVVFGAFDAQYGCCGSVYHLGMDHAFSHRLPAIPGVLSAPCEALLKDFFNDKRGR